MIPNSTIAEHVIDQVLDKCGNNDPWTNSYLSFDLSYEGQDYAAEVEVIYRSSTVDNSTYDTPQVTKSVEISVETCRICNLKEETEHTYTRAEIVDLNACMEVPD